MKCIYDDYSPIHQGFPYRMVGGKRIYLHREALENKLGRPIQEGMMVLHSCANKTCINPEHLYEGTQQDNVANTVAAKRHSYGSSRPMAKLTEHTAYSVLQRLDAGDSGTEIATALGVDASQVSRLKNGKAWNHVRSLYEEEKGKERGDYD